MNSMVCFRPLCLNLTDFVLCSASAQYLYIAIIMDAAQRKRASMLYFANVFFNFFIFFMAACHVYCVE